MTDDIMPSNAEMDDLLGFCVAYMQAGQTRDFDGMEALIGTGPDLVAIIDALSGIANKLGYMLHGREQFAQLLASWQPGRGIPGIHRPPWPDGYDA